MAEVKIGSIVMTAPDPDEDDPRHVLVILRGKGIDGQRPLLGQVTMTQEEWQDVCDHIEQCEREDGIFDRISDALAECEHDATPRRLREMVADAMDARDGGNHRTAAK